MQEDGHGDERDDDPTEITLPGRLEDEELDEEQITGGRAGADHDNGFAEDPPEIRPAETPKSLNDLVESEGVVALVYRCGRCGKTGFAPGQGALMAAGRGVGVAVKCGICGGDILVLTKQAAEQRKLVMPANVHQMPRNRQERRALAKIREAVKRNGGARLK